MKIGETSGEKREEERGQELALIAGAISGDSSAFQRIFNRYQNRVYNLIFYHVGDVVAAEDLLQAVFLKVFRGLPSFRGESSLMTWIYRITLNECRNYLKRRGLRYVPFEAILGTDEETAAGPQPDDESAASEKREVISRALMELSPKLRTVVVLKYVDGLSYDEISAVLNCSQGTVASRLNRALAQLESRLRPLRGLL